MPSLMLRILAVLAALGVFTISLIISGPSFPASDYEVVARLIAGAVFVTGSLCLASAIGSTLLKAGGNATFKASYVSAVAASGIGLSEAFSCVCRVNVAAAVLSSTILVFLTGLLWLRFYGSA